MKKGIVQKMAFYMCATQKDVKAAVKGIFRLAAEQLKKFGSFKLAGMFILKLKVRPATEARKGVNPFTKKPFVFKAKPASNTVTIKPTTHFLELFNSEYDLRHVVYFEHMR